jgi:hypothetical protein
MQDAHVSQQISAGAAIGAGCRQTQEGAMSILQVNLLGAPVLRRTDGASSQIF